MIEVKKILIVVADASRALFYIAHGPHSVTQLDEITEPENHSDHEKLVFSKKVVSAIDKILESQHLDELCICAPPRFMGLMNKDHLKKHIKITEITKEFTHVHSTDILQLIQDAGLNFMPS